MPPSTRIHFTASWRWQIFHFGYAAISRFPFQRPRCYSLSTERDGVQTSIGIPPLLIGESRTRTVRDPADATRRKSDR
jgi:hypothetical protein